MLKGFWDAEKIKELDRDISATVSDMTVTLSTAQIHMQARACARAQLAAQRARLTVVCPRTEPHV